MNTFIKATEIWEPNAAKTRLSLIKGLYGPLKEFEEHSETMTFEYDEGLPGKAWAAKRPIILKELDGSYFKRTEMASKIGLTTAIAMPIFAGEYLHAVVVFLCGDTNDHAGAIELWAKEPDRRTEMGLVEGYYGTMENFEWISKSVKIMRGHGLPGTAWANKMPHIINDLGDSATFLRAKKAAKEGITTALALPVWMHEEDAYVMTFLSAKGTPIARRFEIWVPDDLTEELVFSDGNCDEGTDLKVRYDGFKLDKHSSLSGSVWKTGRPVLTETYDSDEGDVIFDSLLVLPILQNGFFKAIVKFYF